MSACRSCGAEILWCEATVTGRRMPIDPEPSPIGNLVLVHGGRFRVADNDDVPPLHLSHFATCPQANEWRKTVPRETPDDPQPGGNSANDDYRTPTKEGTP